MEKKNNEIEFLSNLLLKVVNLRLNLIILELNPKSYWFWNTVKSDIIDIENEVRSHLCPEK